MRGNYQSPREYVGGCCRAFCSFINPCILLRACLKACFKSSQCSEFCERDCLPDWCPRAADLKDPTQVTGLDHFSNKERIPGYLRKRKRRSRVAKFKSSFFAFLMGLVLTIIYAYLVIFFKSYNFNFCVFSTISIGFFLSIGMAFSYKIRATVFLMMPHLFSKTSRNIILIIIIAMVMNGPASNIIENIKRGSTAAGCGVETVTSQFIEIAKSIKEPLINALKYLKEIAGKVKNVAGKAKNYFQRARESDESKTLNHIWAFIHSIGDICNEELLNPHRKCTKAFADAKEKLLGHRSRRSLQHRRWIHMAMRSGQSWHRRLCHTVLRRRIYAEERLVLAVLQDLKNKFDFNMTVNYDFGGTVNASKSVFTIASDITEEIKQDLDPYREIFHIFSYSIFVIAIFTFYQNAWKTLDSHIFKWLIGTFKNYLTDDNFDNIYITREFIRLDAMRIKQGSTNLLPLSKKESYGLVRPMAWTLTRKEHPILLASMLQEAALPVTSLPSWRMRCIPSGKKNYTVMSKKCIPVPSEPNYYVYLIIGGLFIFAFMTSIFGVYIQRLKRTILAWYFPQREQERIIFLFNNLLTKRVNLETSLQRSVRMNIADEGHSNILMILAAQIPGFSLLTKLFGTTERYCMACAKMTTPAISEDFVECMTNGCKGLYCKDCFELLTNICVICMVPLAYKVDIEEEL
ncbi:LOW QUALITY PROTEIN: DC-STAMP domain-containing protein 2 [Aquarana catesbeiana]|uniref:LOW QUALITY PROTEIN: DC-STAMP domain-containing protein 2 n=1 Tax=Aquarana catesbeiana TaxID=8400 RepID=UPI003CC9A712